MKNIHRFKALTFFWIAADLLAASGSTVRESTTSAKGLNEDANDSSNDDSHGGSDDYGSDDRGGHSGHSGSGDD